MCYNYSMANEIERYAPTSSEVARVTHDYDVARLAGVWVRKPVVQPPDIFPFLALSLSKNEVPLKRVPLFRLDAGTTSERSTFPFPVIKVADNYSDLADEGLVQVVPKKKFSRDKQLQVWLPRRVEPLRLHPPIVEAVGTFMVSAGADWDPATLEETDINKDFVTYKSPLPRQELTMELGGPAQTVATAALAAAAIRLAVAETMAVQDGQAMLDAFMEQNPGARLIRGGEEELGA
jgi:hypothetical protein